ncbi:MAG: SUF system Fe-S cluster assembly protein [Saprospiraceae bacterium]|nr:SUF system Fe-S cluster assembly protein [Saprospiraceae bacterium]
MSKETLTETMTNLTLEEKIIQAVRTVYDPEIPVNIYDLGLIYAIEIDDDGLVNIKMTLTSPACPVAESLPMEVQEKVMMVEEVNNVDLQLVWDPPWNKDLMTDEAKLALDMF